MDVFPSSSGRKEAPTLLCPLERFNLNHSIENVAFVFRIKDKRKQETAIEHVTTAECLLKLLFDPKDEGDMLLRNID
jgi:hypothetical protein